MKLMNDPRPLDPPSYFEDEPEEPTCRLCGVCLTSPAEERRGLCDPCYEVEQEKPEEEVEP